MMKFLSFDGYNVKMLSECYSIKIRQFPNTMNVNILQALRNYVKN